MTATPVKGRRERRKEQTRADILAAATELFDEVGYDAARTAEIARRAGVSEPTVFRYFATKAEIAMAPFQEWVDRLADRFIKLLTSVTPYEASRLMLESTDPSITLGTSGFEALERAMHHPELVSQLFWAYDGAVGRLIPALARTRNVPEDDVRVLLDAKLIVAMLEVSLRYWLQSGGARRPLAVANDCVDRLKDLLDG